MRLLQINAVYGHSSTGTIVENINKYAQQAGIESFSAFSFGNGICDKNYYQIGSKFDHKLHALLCRIAGKQAYFSRYYTRRFLEYLDQLHPDIVHLHNLHSNFINLNILLRYLAVNDIRTIITMHDCWYFTGGCFHYTATGCNKWQKTCGCCPKRFRDTPAYLYDDSEAILKEKSKLINSILRLRIVGCSRWIADECCHSHIGGNDIRTIYNGFDLDVFRPSESNLRKKLNITEKFVILGPGTKWLSKDNASALDYFLTHIDDESVVVLIGGKPSRNLSHYKNVIHLDYVNNREELAGIYSTADVFVNCSKEDTLSSINIEAQACGTPVVTYDSTGNRETISEETGYLVSAGDYYGFLSGVQKIKSCGKTKYQSRCVNWIADNFELVKNTKKYIDLYREFFNE